VPFAVSDADGNGGRPETALAGKLLDELKSSFFVNQQDIHLSASIGISRYPADGREATALLQSADSAMYSAKRDKQGYHFFDKSMHEAARRRLTTGSQLTGALDRNELSVEFQPLYDLATNALIRFEALCRWHNRELGVVPPAEFIPVAEEIGLIDEIGRYVLRQACTEALRWQETGRPSVSIAVNVSPAQFRRKHFVEEVGEILCETSFPARLLELEITESTLMRDLDESVRKMHRLRAMGIGISIDDFGTGYSSLSCLQNMPVEALKIDRSFISRLDQDRASVPMIRSIIAMGHALGLRVVSEGVENERQLKILTDLGSDEVQGYYFGKPEIAGKALERVLRECPSPVICTAGDLVTGDLLAAR
jgi:predicted signal transduction protein with EAL and GGDEF domain